MELKLITSSPSIAGPCFERKVLLNSETWYPPKNTKYLKVIMVGQGGNGGGSVFTSTAHNPGVGGCSGSVGIKVFDLSTGIPQEFIFTLPAAQVQQAVGVAGSAGSAVSASYFGGTLIGPGASLTVPGGRGGPVGVAAGSGTNLTSAAVGSFVGDFTETFISNFSEFSFTNGTPAAPVGGTGADTPLGLGMGGACGSATNTAARNGYPGIGYGAGGGGGYSGSNNITSAGGTGAPAAVILEYMYVA